ncbi:iron ABC transporter permease [Pseudovibrio exalbescens]|uniref:ABC transporter permease n=1 Tax=Pseudovibrio exalbescens TaxID=197461 RepID=UPI0023670CAE|nr:iron ABC transporter permease [Pseudovibrio exalbescens]MDD7911803.1 iron ABC transporter permease [Pseudovibrio exalbescens]
MSLNIANERGASAGFLRRVLPFKPRLSAQWLAENTTLWVIVLAITVLAGWPLLRLATEAVFTNGAFDISPVERALSSRSTWRATMHSLETSFFGMLFAIVLGGFFAFLVALTDIRLKLPLVFCFMLPMMIPPQVTALSWIQVFGPSSALLNTLGIAPEPGSTNPVYSREGIILLLGIQHAPLAFLLLRAAFRQIPRELIEAARMAGAGAQRIAFQIIVPLLTPSLVAAAGLTFVSALGNFGIPAMLGIPESYYVLPTLIYRRLTSFGPSIISDVAILAILVGLIGLAAVLLQNWVKGRIEARLMSKPGAPLFIPLKGLRPLVEALLWLIILMILVLPLSALLATALVPAYGVGLTFETASLENFREILFRQSATLRAFANSGGLALVSAIALAIVAIPLGFFMVWQKSRAAKFAATLSEMPYALPGVVLSIAMILVFLKPLPIIGISLYGTLGIILVAYLARFLSLAIKPVIAGFEQLDPKLDEAARIVGASFFDRLFRIAAPLLGPVAAAGGILVFMTAMNELTVSALLWSAGNETLGVLVFNLDDGGYTVLSSALAVVTVVVIFLIMLIAQSLSRVLPRGVLPWTDDQPHTKR